MQKKKNRRKKNNLLGMQPFMSSVKELFIRQLSLQIIKWSDVPFSVPPSQKIHSKLMVTARICFYYCEIFLLESSVY